MNMQRESGKVQGRGYWLGGLDEPLRSWRQGIEHICRPDADAAVLRKSDFQEKFMLRKKSRLTISHLGFGRLMLSQRL